MLCESRYSPTEIYGVGVGAGVTVSGGTRTCCSLICNGAVIVAIGAGVTTGGIAHAVATNNRTSIVIARLGRFLKSLVNPMDNNIVSNTPTVIANTVPMSGV